MQKQLPHTNEILRFCRDPGPEPHFMRPGPHKTGFLFCLLPPLNTYNGKVILLRTNGKFPLNTLNIFM